MKAILTLLLVSLSGCALGLGKSVHQYGMLDVEDAAGLANSKPITVEKKQYVFLSFIFDADYVDDAYRALLAECPNGDITNIRTKHSTDLGFLAYNTKIKIEAVCLAKQ